MGYMLSFHHLSIISFNKQQNACVMCVFDAAIARSTSSSKGWPDLSVCVINRVLMYIIVWRDALCAKTTNDELYDIGFDPGTNIMR